MTKAIVFEWISLNENVKLKNADPIFAYPSFEVLGKPDNSYKQSRNPRCVYTF